MGQRFCPGLELTSLQLIEPEKNDRDPVAVPIFQVQRIMARSKFLATVEKFRSVLKQGLQVQEIQLLIGIFRLRI